MLRFHREGYKIIAITFAIVIAGILLSDQFVELFWLQKTFQIGCLALLILILQFFRNPRRKTEINTNHIIAPVDGKVVVIEEVEEPEVYDY